MRIFLFGYVAMQPRLDNKSQWQVLYREGFSSGFLSPWISWILALSSLLDTRTLKVLQYRAVIRILALSSLLDTKTLKVFRYRAVMKITNTLCRTTGSRRRPSSLGDQQELHHTEDSLCSHWVLWVLVQRQCKHHLSSWPSAGCQ